MRFRLFGIPIHIQFGFWLIGLLLGYDILQGPYKFNLAVWIAVVFVSIMVHELGHAFAMLRYGIQPEITLYMLGGLCAGPGMGHLSRPRRVFISFAGPLAGFVLGSVLWAGSALIPALSAPLSAGAGTMEIALRFALRQAIWVNFGWGIINLIPVLPLDGGHVLEDLLGPQRLKTTALVSLVAGGLVVLWCLAQDPVEIWIAFIFGMATMQSFQRYRAASAPTSAARAVPKAPPEETLPPELDKQLRSAKEALEDGRHEEAGTLAELVLAERPPQRARLLALEIIAWAHLLDDRPEEAARAIRAIERDGVPDAALVGAVLLQTGETEQAREVLEAARAAGDDRKEVVGPLIQILIAADEVARAAAIALDIVDTLSEEDARQMANIAYEREAYGWAARLAEALFERTASPNDAYDAVRGRAAEGDLAAAFSLLRRAVAAGFSDAARVWSDKALEPLRHEGESELEELLPRPTGAD